MKHFYFIIHKYLDLNDCNVSFFAWIIMISPPSGLISHNVSNAVCTYHQYTWINCAADRWLEFGKNFKFYENLRVKYV